MPNNTYEMKRSRSGALVSSWVHIIPVAITFSILQLSFRNYYWADADAKNQRLQLSALQVAAKAHEILILVSLSSMVLHYTRKLMVSPEGISFGLLEAAFQSGLSSNPWTIGNWEALKHLKSQVKNRKKTREGGPVKGLRAWHMVVILVVFAFLALFVGPASAITLIPQLGWWHRQDLIGSMYVDRYTTPSPLVYITADLFPTEVDDSHLSGPYCYDAAKDMNNTCPSARMAEIQRSFTIPMPGITPKTQNMSISLHEDEPITRRMLYSQNGHKAAVTVSNYVLASFASLLKLPAFVNGGTYQSPGPFTVEISANGASPLDPIVGVECNDTRNDLFLRGYNYELDGFDWNQQRKVSIEDVRKTGFIDIRSIWSEDKLKDAVNGTDLVWKDVTNTTGSPVMLALLRHERNVTVCSMQAHWMFTSQWILSTSNYDIATNFTFDKKFDMPWSTFGYLYTLVARDIHLHENWVEALNPVNGSVKLLDALLQYGLQTVNNTVKPSSNSNSSMSDHTYPYFAATISQLLAKTIANGLSRIGAQYAADHFVGSISANNLTICNDKTAWCSEGPWFPRRVMPLAVVPNISRENSYLYFDPQLDASWWNDTSPILHSFPKPAGADEKWTRISFPVRNYGYAYSFQGIVMYLAVALLCLHAAMVLAHVVYRVAIDCQTFDFGGSLGSLLVLAMGDKAPAGSNMWTERVVVVRGEPVETEQKFKIQVIGKNEDTIQRMDSEHGTILTK
ncbi:hypothetical protein DE146DRAFT_750318 [Phaeosphaeria sp. MPI-PUGE-AT-0046c]|nr:hypothetical protein DE146DRAFT_750318 [Phaeosphaeria sp. MPI-PUGE-AT-0046c]